MGVNILEALLSAEYNLNSSVVIQRQIGMNQLHNAVTLLEKGYDLYEKIDDVISEHGGNVENVPEKE